MGILQKSRNQRKAIQIGSDDEDAGSPSAQRSASKYQTPTASSPSRRRSPSKDQTPRRLLDPDDFDDDEDKKTILSNLQKAFFNAGKSKLQMENEIFNLLSEAGLRFDNCALLEFAMTMYVRYILLEKFDWHLWAISLLLPPRIKTNYKVFTQSHEDFFERHIMYVIYIFPLP